MARQLIDAVLADPGLLTVRGTVNRQKVAKVMGVRLAVIAEILEELDELRGDL